MSNWANSNPEKVGTSSDPWMIHESYRVAMRDIERDCEACGYFARLDDDGVCALCRKEARGA